MTPPECPFESEVLSAVVEGRWPQSVDAELRAHAAACAVCAEAASVATALNQDRRQLRAAAEPPGSGRVWWMAQMRARREAVAAANRAIDIAAALALMFAVAAVWALLPVSDWLAALASRIGWNAATMIAVGVAAAIFIPAAACLAFSRD